jgi:hypothetical protein
MWFSAAQQCSSTNRNLKENSNKTSEKPSNNPPKAESQYKPLFLQNHNKNKSEETNLRFSFSLLHENL